jgi:O-antigen/teichoic acid export membrane protein
MGLGVSLATSPQAPRGAVRARLFRGFGANLYSQIVTMAVQLGSVPLLLSAWGPPTYGLWLVISAVASYLALADFGFAPVAANDMTLAIGRGDHAQARRSFQSVSALNGLIGIALVSAVTLAGALAPERWAPNTALVSASEVRLVCELQGFQVALTLFCGVLEGGFLSSGRYALAVLLSSSARLLESAALVSGALLFHGFAVAAALMLAVRVATTIVMAVWLAQGAPWLRLGFRHARLAEIRRLASPAIAVMAVPMAFAVSLQGFVLVVGATLSLDAVAAFSTARTLTRTTLQAGNMINHAVMPELTRAFGAGDRRRVEKLLRLNLISVLALNAAAFVMVLLFGSLAISLWTGGRIPPDPLMIVGLATVAGLHGLWLSQANLILAINRHSSYAYWFLAICAASVLAAIPSALALGPHGLLIPLLSGECAMIAIVGRAFRATFGRAGVNLRFLARPGPVAEPERGP